MFVIGDLVLGFFNGGDAGEGGGIAGLMMVGDGMISAVCGLCWCLMVEGVDVCSVWTAGGGVSFSVSEQVSIWSSVLWLERAGRATHQQRVQAASCFQPSFCSKA